EAVIARPGVGELRFCPGGDHLDLYGRSWSLEGSLSVLGAKRRDGWLISPDHPDAFDRVWSALNCPTSGEVLLSAAPGREFSDLGGQAHVGGGSHGSLRGEDSLGALILCGVGISHVPRQWSIRDLAPLVLEHFAS
ncbi:MAG TPA: alkaline phosphatase family protein, partial [Solirubrobacteraceae bacterium]|nr:alkaline phosphatase family protein [Solirubrobacteraceae bacterium]